LYLELFSNDVTLSAAMTPTSCTVLTAGGYTGMIINQTAWCVPYLSAGSAEVSASGQVANGFQFSFTAAPNQSAFGYMIWNTAAATAIVVEKFASNYYLQNAGDTITIKPKVRAT
jgi:hypothetical protein